MHKKISEQIFDFVLDKLCLNESENLMKTLSHSPKKSDFGCSYHDKSLICVCVRANNVVCCKKLIFILGDDAFINAMFEADHLNICPLEYAIKSSKIETIEFLFGIKQITQ